MIWRLMSIKKHGHDRESGALALAQPPVLAVNKEGRGTATYVLDANRLNPEARPLSGPVQGQPKLSTCLFRAIQGLV